jgi:predicted transcriptional regulator YdeE
LTQAPITAQAYPLYLSAMKTTEHIIKNDIPVLCAKAATFPEGVLDAFRYIENADPAFCRRTFYGLSRGNKTGGIDYWAAVEARQGDKSIPGIDKKVIAAGNYAAVTINDFRKNISSIGTTFDHLLQNRMLDESSYCVELYENDTVTCMVKLVDAENN